MLLVGPEEIEYVIPAAQLPEGASPGTWLRVRIERGIITTITVDEQATREAADRIARKMDALRERGRGSSKNRRVK